MIRSAGNVAYCSGDIHFGRVVSVKVRTLVFRQS
jgi:hypothetical protein